MGVITITMKDYDDAVKKALAEFVDFIGKEDDTAEAMFTTMLMGMQNSAFAASVRRNLFSE